MFIINQTIVSFICVIYTMTFHHMWSWKCGLKSWKVRGQHVYEPCLQSTI